MSLTGTLRLPHEGRTGVEPREDVVDLTKGKPMASSVQCAECDHPPFTGPGMWRAYGGHLREAHPQTVPTPAPRQPGPPAAEDTPAPTGEKEAPAMATRIPCREGCESIGGEPRTFDSQHGEDVHYARVHGPNAVKAAPRALPKSIEAQPAVQSEPNPTPGLLIDTAGYLPRIEAGSATITAGPPPRHPGSVHHGGSIPGFIGFDAMADDLEAAEKALLEAIAKPLHVRFENGYSVAWVDVEEIEVLVQGQRVIYLTSEDREAVHAAEATKEASAS